MEETGLPGFSLPQMLCLREEGQQAASTVSAIAAMGFPPISWLKSPDSCPNCAYGVC